VTHGPKSPNEWSAEAVERVRTLMTSPREERPVELEGVPAEEGISEADVTERLDEDPAKQVNKPDQGNRDRPAEQQDE